MYSPALSYLSFSSNLLTVGSTTTDAIGSNTESIVYNLSFKAQKPYLTTYEAAEGLVDLTIYHECSNPLVKIEKKQLIVPLPYDNPTVTIDTSGAIIPVETALQFD